MYYTFSMIADHMSYKCVLYHLKFNTKGSLLLGHHYLVYSRGCCMCNGKGSSYPASKRELEFEFGE